MPTRIMRGEINSSASLARVSLSADLTFRALIVAVDDYGRLDARPAILKAALYPLRYEVTPAKLMRWVEELAQEGCVQLYSVDGRPYLQLTGWEKHRGTSKRAVASKYPTPLSPGDSQDIRGNPGDPPVLRLTSDEYVGRIAASPPAERAADAAPTTAGPLQSADPPEPKRPKRRVLTDAPIALEATEQAALEAWCRSAYPALLPRLHALVTACLDFHRAKGNRHADWLATCRTWVRNEAEGRFGTRRDPPQTGSRAPDTFHGVRDPGVDYEAERSKIRELIAARRGGAA